MKSVKLGLIGLGHIGRHHAENLFEKRVPGAELTAVATAHPEWIQKRAPFVRVYSEAAALLRDVEIDGVLICTPHRLHVPQAIEALHAGKHVLIEKPVAADWHETGALCQARDASGCLVGVMFHLRTSPVYRSIKAILQEQRLGRISRVAWTMTAWSRDQAYYDQADWRGTWAGEGGGVLLNQCAHHLDLLYWYFGLPVHLQAVCGFGKHHRIE
ncbi:MAG: Gfo/Idh/MocA family oxidoreductase, partial [Kiritimatiellae bacterium]|nr:Gfo/Idh/MocA family oxidoreductase [Kiritimatiellia bacterium]